MLKSLSPKIRWMVRTALLGVGVGIVVVASGMLGHGFTLSLFGICSLLLFAAVDWIMIVGGGARNSSRRDDDRPGGSPV